MTYPEFVIVDVEDTGFSDTGEPIPQQVIEVAALRVSWPSCEVVGAFYRRWMPTIPVLPAAAKVNGYSAIDWLDREPVTALDMMCFSNFVRGAEWVGSLPTYDFERLDVHRREFNLPRFPLATHRMVNVASEARPLTLAMESKSSGQEAIIASLTALGMPVPPVPDDLASMAGGRSGPHTAMGDAWGCLHIMRRVMRPSFDYWQAQKAMRAAA